MHVYLNSGIPVINWSNNNLFANASSFDMANSSLNMEYLSRRLVLDKHTNMFPSQLKLLTVLAFLFNRCVVVQH